MSSAELAVLIFILTGFGAFMVTLASVSRQPRTPVKAAKRKVHHQGPLGAQPG
jgi:hypothetical protein